MGRSARYPASHPGAHGSHVSRALLIVAVLIAAVTRLGWLRLIEFQNDESWALSIASSIARGEAFPLVGIGSSLDVPNAPFFVYLMALPEIFTRDPSVATGLIGLLGTTAVAATYGFARCLFDRPTAVSAALLYAVSPWGIVFSRKVWGQDALPLFVTLGFWALFGSVLSGRRSWIAPGVVLLTLASQLHPTAFFLAVPALLLIGGCIGLDWPEAWPTLRWLGIGLLAAGAIEMPFVVWQAQHGWPLVHAVGHLARDPGRVDLSALRWAGSAIAGSGYPALAQVGNLWKPAGFVEVGLLLGGLALLLTRAVRSGAVARRLSALALLVWIAAPVLAQIHHSVPIYPHYFIVLYPACYVVMGAAVAALWSFVPPFVRLEKLTIEPVRIAAIVAVAAPVILGIVAFTDYVAALERSAVRPDFGVPLQRQEELFDAANRLAAGGPIYFGTHDSLAPTLAYLSDGRWRIFDDRRGLRLPSSDHASVLAISDQTTSAGTLAARWLDAERVSTIRLTDWSTVTLYRLAPGVAEAAPGFHPMNAAFDVGMTLTGYRIASDPERREIRIDLHWRFDGTSPPKPPTVFNHLLDPRGETVAHVDGLAYDPTDWRAGELALIEFDMPWPTAPGPYRLEVGLYDYPSMKRFQLLRPAAGAPADSLDLGPVDLVEGGGP